MEVIYAEVLYVEFYFCLNAFLIIKLKTKLIETK